MQVDDDCEDGVSRDQIHDVGEALTPEYLVKCTTLVVSGEEQMEERDDGTLELRATAGVDNRVREGLALQSIDHVVGHLVEMGRLR